MHTPAQPTCGLKTFDFFVSSASLAFAVVGVANVVDAGSHPHAPARLYLRAAPRSIMVRSLCKPARFSATLPAGCLPAPPNYAMIAAVQDCNAQSVDYESLNDGFGEWVRKVEGELADVCGLAGKARETACCRAVGPRFAMKPALGEIASQLQRVSPVTAAWRVVAAWLLKLLRALSVAPEYGMQRDSRAQCSICKVIRRFRRHKWANLGAHADAE